jgi:transcriptional regulator with XRE-family HTH domain
LLQLPTQKEQNMQLGEKISVMRNLKGLTQEEMAKKLNMSSTGYAKIERGETKLQNPRLDKIVEALGIELKDLLNFNAESLFKTSFHDQCSNNYVVYINSAIELTQELEKMRLKLEAKEIENKLLHEKIADLNRIIKLLENSKI